MDAVRKVEIHRARPLPQVETKRRASSGGCTIPLHVGDEQGAAGRDVADDVVGNIGVVAANVTNEMLVRIPLYCEKLLLLLFSH